VVVARSVVVVDLSVVVGRCVVVGRDVDGASVVLVVGEAVDGPASVVRTSVSGELDTVVVVQAASVDSAVTPRSIEHTVGREPIFPGQNLAGRSTIGGQDTNGVPAGGGTVNRCP